jgi:hypothetical protein
VTRAEFIPIWAYLTAAVAKEASKQTVEAYFDLLADLSTQAVQAGVKLALAESQFPGIPPVGVIRKFACEIMTPERPSAADAWGMVLKAIRVYGWNLGGQALQDLPEPVSECARKFGWNSLCDTTNLEVCRAQFLKMYESLVVAEKKQTSMPASVRQLCEQLGRNFDPESSYARIEYRGKAGFEESLGPLPIGHRVGSEERQSGNGRVCRLSTQGARGDLQNLTLPGIPQDGSVGNSPDTNSPIS